MTPFPGNKNTQHRASIDSRLLWNRTVVFQSHGEGAFNGYDWRSDYHAGFAENIESTALIYLGSYSCSSQSADPVLITA